jgi:NAD(P)-dependent dehydrogenase (short-subunit alcohol dehydrogenase family)
MPIDISGRTAIVTGGNSGVGKAIAKTLGRAGANVAIVARRQEKNQAVAEAICADGGQAASFACDVAELEQVQAMVAQVEETFGTPEILINNAGFPSGGRLLEVEPDLWHDSFRCMVHGQYYCTREVYKLARPKGRLHEITIASVAGCANGAKEICYGTTKAAQIKFELHLRQEFNHAKNEVQSPDGGPGDFHCHCLCPGGIDTPFMTEKCGVDPDKAQRTFLRPDDLADLTLMCLTHPTEMRPFFEEYTAGPDKPYVVEPLWLFDKIPWVLKVWSKHPEYHEQGDKYPRPDWMK